VKNTKHTTMPKETLHKEIDHECNIHKKIGIFFMGMKHAFKQVQSKLLTSLAKIENAKLQVVQKMLEVSIPPFYFACTQALIGPRGTPSECKLLGLLAFNHLTYYLAILILVL
jgi:hypothetical protein